MESQQNKALQRQPQSTDEKVLGLMLSDEKSVILALKSKHVSVASDEELKSLLLRIYNIIGLPPEKWIGMKSDSDSEEVKQGKDFLKSVLYSDLRTGLPNTTIDEVVEAFKSASFGFNRFNSKEKTGFDLNLYDKSFSFSFIAGCVAEYKKYSMKIVHEFNIKKKQAEQFVEEVRLTPEQKGEKAITDFEDLEIFIQTNKQLPMIWKWSESFQVAEWRGFIKDTKEEKEMFMEVVKVQLQEEIERDKDKLTTFAFKAMVTNVLSENNIVYECRKRRLIIYLKEKFNISN